MKNKLLHKDFFGGVILGVNTEKMKEVIHYIISKCGYDGNLWRTTLYKILYFSDFNFYEIYETPITNEDYAKFPKGPLPTHFINVKNELVKEGKIEEIHKYPFEGAYHKGYNYTLLTSPEIKLLKTEEIEIIDSVIEKLSGMNTEQISHYSHGDMPWIVAERNEILDYRYVFYRNEKYSVREYHDNV
jgi:uncharacterized phage-associated protein